VSPDVADKAGDKLAAIDVGNDQHVASVPRPQKNILVIKLGALGDFVQAMGPAAAIRAHHADAAITLLTTRPFAELARAAPYFDHVWIDDRPGHFDLPALWQLRHRLRAARFDRVYDLQTSPRSSWYFHLIGPGRPEWSGIARGCSHPHANPARDRMHTLDRQAEQLRVAGVGAVAPPDLGWAKRDITHFDLPDYFLVLVPGGSRHRPEKRWPAGRYAQLASLAARRGLTPVIIGGADEHEVGREITRSCPAARDLTGRTSFGDIVGLGAAALAAVGNDTGPVHMLVAAGSPATVLYSSASDPRLTQPRGRSVIVLQRANLADLTVDEVAATLHLS
jgi:ADP-heptose:LPS heptosyltransferase